MRLTLSSIHSLHKLQRGYTSLNVKDTSKFARENKLIAAALAINAAFTTTSLLKLYLHTHYKHFFIKAAYLDY